MEEESNVHNVTEYSDFVSADDMNVSTVQTVEATASA